MRDGCRAPVRPFAMIDGRAFDVGFIQVHAFHERGIEQVCNIELLQRNAVNQFIDFYVFLHTQAFETGLVGRGEDLVARYCCGQVWDWLNAHPLQIGYSTERVDMHVNGSEPEIFIP